MTVEKYKSKLEKAEKKIEILEQMIEDHTRQLYLANIDLQNQNKELQQFVYIASHDLQEPLRTITSFIELLKEQYHGQLDDQSDLYLKFILEASQRMSKLIKGLLDYSRIGRSTEMESVDCNLILDQIQNDLGDKIKQSKTILNSENLPVIQGYQLEIRQLFQNLISNAIKFQKNNNTPKIAISYKDEIDHWAFAFADNGIGIDEEYCDKIFLIFQRLHTHQEYEGTGIGLANCQKIVNLHGGKIWLKSKLEFGSTFYFTIPKIKS